MPLNVSVLALVRRWLPSSAAILSPHSSGRAALLSTCFAPLRHALASQSTVREITCLISRTVLSALQKQLPAAHFEFCAFFGYFPAQKFLMLKGASGIAPAGLLHSRFALADGFLTGASASQLAATTRDLATEDGLDALDKALLLQYPRLTLAAYPLVSENSSLVGLLVLGNFGATNSSWKQFQSARTTALLATLAKNLAPFYQRALLALQARNTSHFSAQIDRLSVWVKLFYKAPPFKLKPSELIVHLGNESLKLLNGGNSHKRFYTNFLFYEFQPNGQIFVLRYSLNRRYDMPHFTLHSEEHRSFLQDGRVVSVEGQSAQEGTTGKMPYTIRYIDNQVENVRIAADANWSPAGSGSAFILPLFEDQDRPLGVFVFLAPHQRRRYMSDRPAYAEKERRSTSLFDLKLFSALQPLMTREYLKLKMAQREQVIGKLDEIMAAFRDIITVDDRVEVLSRLATLTMKLLDCEACLIYLSDNCNFELKCVAASGFTFNLQAKQRMNSFLVKNANRASLLPLSLYRKGTLHIANGEEQFRNHARKNRHCTPLFRDLKSHGVVSYIGCPIDSAGIVEVFNARRQGSSAFSFFEEHQQTTLQYISKAIAIVLRKIEATKATLRSEKVRTTHSLLLDIGDELRTPVYITANYANSLAKILAEGDFEKNQESICDIANKLKNSTDRTQEILRKLKRFEEIVRKQPWQRINLAALIQDVLRAHKPLLEKYGIECSVSCGLARPLVEGAVTPLSEVFAQLINNSIEAMPQGGQLAIKVTEENSRICVAVRDTGNGISRELKGRVFDAFVTTKHPAKGFGMSLCVSRKIVLQHQGDIAFESNSGEGTTFYVQLPAIA